MTEMIAAENEIDTRGQSDYSKEALEAAPLFNQTPDRHEGCMHLMSSMRPFAWTTGRVSGWIARLSRVKLPCIAMVLALSSSMTGCRNDLQKSVPGMDAVPRPTAQNEDSHDLRDESARSQTTNITNVRSSTGTATKDGSVPGETPIRVIAEFPTEIAVNLRGEQPVTQSTGLHVAEPLKVPVELDATKPVQALVTFRSSDTRPLTVPVKIVVDGPHQPEPIRIQLKVEVTQPDAVTLKVNGCGLGKDAGVCPSPERKKQPELPFSFPQEKQRSDEPSAQRGSDGRENRVDHRFDMLWDIAIIIAAGLLGGMMRTLEDRHPAGQKDTQSTVEGGEPAPSNTPQKRRRLSQLQNAESLFNLENYLWGLMAAWLVPMVLFFAKSSLPDKQDVSLYRLAFFGTCLVAATLGAEFWRMVMSVARHTTERFAVPEAGARSTSEPPPKQTPPAGP